ncbi:MAG: hypothetical protein C4332_16075, partial [Meiothermus sp.]
EDAYGYYNRDLIAKGWTQVNYRTKGNRNKPEYWAEYRRGGERAQLRIKLERGQVRVSLNWNGDDDRHHYDDNDN